MKKLLISPRQKRITNRANGGRKAPKQLLWITVIVLLVALLVAALLFVQASKAAGDLKKINQNNAAVLSKVVADTSNAIRPLNMQKDEDTTKALRALTNLSTSADSVAASCASAAKPYVKTLAKKYEEILQDCAAITEEARQLRDGINTFLPIAQYQVDLAKALVSVTGYHQGEDKTDITKGVEVWRDMHAKLQSVTPPQTLDENHTKLINLSNDVTETLQKAKEAKDANNTSEYTAALVTLDQQYVLINDTHDPIHEQLAKAQKMITAAVNNLRS